MRSRISEYRFHSPATLVEALERLAAEPGRWRAFAGGTDLMVLLEAGKLPHRDYLNLWPLSELRGIRVQEHEVVIGALTTYTEVRRHPTLQLEFPLLCEAAAETGGVATQNRGTVGGNIANASPAADTPPVLLAYGAALDLMSVRGTRSLEYAAFHTGYKQMDLAPDELIAAIRISRGRAGSREVFRKIGTRRAQAISKVCFAGWLSLSDRVVADIRLAFGSVGPAALRARHAEDAVRGHRLGGSRAADAAEALATDLSPIDDDRSTARYRLRVAQNVLRAFLSDESEGAEVASS